MSLHDVSTVRRAGFWPSTAILALFLFAAGIPTPLYRVYADAWGFSAGVLTVVFGVYALSLLGALVVFGGLSDALGRKPVVLGASVALAGSLLVFVAADGVGWLLAARLLQGAATGLLTSAASAAMLDLEPSDRPGLASLANVLAAMGGQAAGVLVSGVLVEFGPVPLRLVYLVTLVAVMAGTAVFLVRVPEPVTTRTTFRPSVRIGVSPGVRAAFRAATPCLVATWALSSFFLSLGPELVVSVTGAEDGLVSVTAAVVLLLAGAASAFSTRGAGARARMLGGCAVLTVGAAISVGALALRDAPTLLTGTFVAGLGFGTAFSGAMETLTALARAEDRAALVSAIYVVAYLSFSVPAVIAGVASTRVGLIPTAIGYSALVGVLAFAALIATRRTTGRSERRTRPAPPPA